jgi:hypothetical protein
VDNTVQVVKAAPCLKYWPQVTGNFPGLRAAIRSMGLEPTFIHVNREDFQESEKTIVIKVELSHDKLPEFYRKVQSFNKIFLVSRTQVSYSPKKHLIFLMDDTMGSQLHWLSPQRRALHLDLKTNEWSVGPGQWPPSTKYL